MRPCAKDCGRPASTAKAGRSAAARIEGLCYECWKAAHPKKRLASGSNGHGLAKAFSELEGLFHELDGISSGLVSGSAELLERCRRFAHEINERIGGVRGMAPLIERRVREANAELRRQVKLGRTLHLELSSATKALPAIGHGEIRPAAGGQS